MGKKKSRRVRTQVHTRKLDRSVARANMKKVGIPKVNRAFAQNWKRFVEA